MAKDGKSPKIDANPALGGLAAAAQAAQSKGGQNRPLPPVHLWNPPHCGDIGMKITRDGVWHYQGSPIGRPELVKLFASILRKDPEGHVLVTPVEKVTIEVEDAPFLAVALEIEPDGGSLVLRTNVGDEVRVDAAHPLRFETGPAEGLKPYVLVRGGLWALVTRALFYDLVELGERRVVDGVEMFGVASGGAFFAMARADEMDLHE